MKDYEEKGTTEKEKSKMKTEAEMEMDKQEKSIHHTPCYVYTCMYLACCPVNCKQTAETFISKNLQRNKKTESAQTPETPASIALLSTSEHSTPSLLSICLQVLPLTFMSVQFTHSSTLHLHTPFSTSTPTTQSD